MHYLIHSDVVTCFALILCVYMKSAWHAWIVVVAQTCAFSPQGAAEVLVSWFGRYHRVVLVGLTTHEVALYTAELASSQVSPTLLSQQVVGLMVLDDAKGRLNRRLGLEWSWLGCRENAGRVALMLTFGGQQKSIESTGRA